MELAEREADEEEPDSPDTLREDIRDKAAWRTS
jgi:hypothetical protein